MSPHAKPRLFSGDHSSSEKPEIRDKQPGVPQRRDAGSVSTWLTDGWSTFLLFRIGIFAGNVGIFAGNSCLPVKSRGGAGGRTSASHGTFPLAGNIRPDAPHPPTRPPTATRSPPAGGAEGRLIARCCINLLMPRLDPGWCGGMTRVASRP